MYNLHTNTKGVPYTADDLLGKGDRDKRKAEKVRGDLQSRLLEHRISREIKDGTAEIPDWALNAVASARQKAN